MTGQREQQDRAVGVLPGCSRAIITSPLATTKYLTGRAGFGSWLEGTVYRSSKDMAEGAWGICSHHIHSQEVEMDAGTQLTFFFSFSLGPQSMGWYHPHWRTGFSTQLTYSRKSRTDGAVSLVDEPHLLCQPGSYKVMRKDRLCLSLNPLSEITQMSSIWMWWLHLWHRNWQMLWGSFILFP